MEKIVHKCDHCKKEAPLFGSSFPRLCEECLPDYKALVPMGLSSILNAVKEQIMEKTVEDYQMDIVNAQIAITRIQDACPHDKGYECMMYSYRIGAHNPSRLCLICRVPLSGITAEEDAEVRKNWFNLFTVTENE